MVRCLTTQVTTLQQDAAIKKVAESNEELILGVCPDIEKDFKRSGQTGRCATLRLVHIIARQRGQRRKVYVNRAEFGD